MTLLDAVSIRTSLRSYRHEPISTVQQQQLEKTISQLNASSGLRIQLACGRPEPFRSFSKSYGMLTGVTGGAHPHRRVHGARHLLGGRDLR